MIWFKLDKVKGEDRMMVEVWNDDIFIAGIYPHEGEICVVSRYLADVRIDEKYPRSVIIRFVLLPKPHVA